MINNVSEGLLRSTTKVDPNAVVHDRALSQEKVEQAKENRPVENTEAGVKTEAENADDKGSSKFMQVQKTMVFEKYNKNGDVILRIPPSAKPVNEIA